MDIALASIITCVNSVKILPQESSVKTACQVITGIRLMEDSAQLVHAVAMQIFVTCTQENVSAQLKESKVINANYVTLKIAMLVIHLEEHVIVSTFAFSF